MDVFRWILILVSHVFAGPSCSESIGCANLVGDCCPTPGGDTLSCCSMSNTSVVTLPKNQLEEQQCSSYCSTTGCDWTKYYSCPWQPLGINGKAAVDNSVGYECCCSARTTSLQPCGGDPTCSITTNQDCYGEDLWNIGASSAADCCKWCQRTENCEAFSFRTDEQVCYLKSGCSSPQTCETCIVGRTARTVDSHNKIICPFLGTMVHENALPVRLFYTRRELTDLVVNAGLSAAEAGPHIHAQFREISTNLIDIFDMEGLPDEHNTSTGINDCFTDYSKFPGCPASDAPGPTQSVRICPTPNKNCGVPNLQKFEKFWDFFSGGSVITTSQLAGRVDAFFSQALDHNTDSDVEGQLDDAFKFMLHVFADSDSMSQRDMVALMGSRTYPDGYAFGPGCKAEGAPEVTTIVDNFGHSLQFGIRSYRGRWLALDSSGAVVSSTSKHLWTVQINKFGDGYTNFRSSDNGRWMYAGPDGQLGSAPVPREWEKWSLVKYTTDTGSKVNLKSMYDHFLTVDYDNGIPRISAVASRDEEFELVYCSLPGFMSNETII